MYLNKLKFGLNAQQYVWWKPNTPLHHCVLQHTHCQAKQWSEGFAATGPAAFQTVKAQMHMTHFYWLLVLVCSPSLPLKTQYKDL